MPRAAIAPVTSSARRSGTFGWLPVLCIAGVTSLLYANTLAVPFLLDDPFEITRNTMVTRLAPLWTYFTRARGIVMLSLAANYAWTGTEVTTYHLVNLGIHALNGLLVFALVASTLRLPYFNRRYDAHAGTLALIVSLVFIAHPLQIMAVTYIVQRAESLATFFYLLTLVLFVFGATRWQGRKRLVAFAGAVAASVLGVLTKQTVVTVPIMVILYHLCFLRGRSQRDSARRWTVALLVTFVVGVTLATSWSQVYPLVGTRPSYLPPTAGFAVEGITPGKYLATQAGVIVWYLRLFLIPTQQCFDYGWPLVDRFWRTDVILPALGLAAIATVALASIRRYRLATFCIAWFFVTLAPSSSFIPLRDVAFEHRMYLPIVGLAWLIVVGGYDAAGWLATRTGMPVATVRNSLAVVAGLWIATLAVLTVARNSVFRDPVLLAADSVAKAPHHWRNHFEYGRRLMEAGKQDDAIVPLREAVRLDGHQGPPHLYLAEVYLGRGEVEAAEAELIPVLQAPEPSVVAAAQRQLGLLNEGTHQFDRAVNHYVAAIQIMPNWTNTRKRLAWLYEKQGQWELAAQQYEAVLRSGKADDNLRTRAALAYYRTGLRQLAAGHGDQAIASLQASIHHRDSISPVHHYLAVAFARRGDWDKADTEIATAARLDPNAPGVQANVERIRRREQPTSPKARKPAPS